MPPRSLIDTLPVAVRDGLNQRLVGSAYGDLDGMVAWLAEQGFTIGRSTVGRYSQGLKESMEKALERARTRLECAKALGGLNDGDKAKLLEANEMILMDKLMDVMDDWDQVAPEDRPKALASLIRAASDLGRSAVGTAKWSRQVEADIRAQAAESAAGAAREAGLSEASVENIRRRVLQMAS